MNIHLISFGIYTFVKVESQFLMIVVYNQLDDLKTSKSIKFLSFSCKFSENLNNVCVIFLKIKDSEPALIYLPKNGICFFFDILVLFLFEAVASDSEDDPPSGFEIDMVIVHKIA